MQKIFQQLHRFIQIDIQYLGLPLPLIQKLSDILRTDVRLFLNLLFRSKTKPPVQIGVSCIFYDTPFATKTLLTTIYDFYTETKKATILPSKPVVIDIGANIGQFIIAVKQFYPGAKVYSCEPDGEVFEILKKNADQYSLTEVYNYALSDKNANSVFYKSKAFSEWSGLSPVKGLEYEKIQVQLKKGDDLFSSVKRVDLLKIDVEGAELEVLTGLVQTMKKSRYILIELSLGRSANDLGSRKVLSFLFANNYTIDHIGRIFSDSSGTYQGAFDVLLKNIRYE